MRRELPRCSHTSACEFGPPNFAGGCLDMCLFLALLRWILSCVWLQRKAKACSSHALCRIASGQVSLATSHQRQKEEGSQYPGLSRLMGNMPS